MKKVKKKKSKRSVFKKQLDQVCKEYIKFRDNYICCTCGYKGYKGDPDTQWGHLFSSVRENTRWDELNVHVQCRSCNNKHEYDFEPYRKFFVDKYSQKIYDDLYLRWNDGKSKMTIQDFEDKIKYFKKKLEEYDN